MEKDLQDTKNYYNKRIREIEEKAKYGKLKNGKTSEREEPKSGRSNQSESELKKELKAEREKNAHLTTERNMFAKRLAEVEQLRNQERGNSLSGITGSPRGGS